MEGRGKVFAGVNWELSVGVFRGKPDLAGPGIISAYIYYGEILRSDGRSLTEIPYHSVGPQCSRVPHRDSATLQHRIHPG